MDSYALGPPGWKPMDNTKKALDKRRAKIIDATWIRQVCMTGVKPETTNN